MDMIYVFQAMIWENGKVLGKRGDKSLGFIKAV